MLTAVRVIQRVFRGYRARRHYGNHSERLNLVYELFLMRKRLMRRQLLVGLFRHCIHLLILCAVIWLQVGQAVKVRFDLEHTVSDHVQKLTTPGGLKHSELGNIDQAWEWMQDAFFASVQQQEVGAPVYIRTYNKLIGTVRISTTRISDRSCTWKYTAQGSCCFRLMNEVDECYGDDESFLLSEPYGPTHDPSRYTSVPGTTQYTIDLGIDPDFARKRLQELRAGDFVSKQTRSLDVKLVVYNNALPMLTHMSLSTQVRPTGTVINKVSAVSIDVQPYMSDSWWIQIALEIFLCFITILSLRSQLQSFVSRFTRVKTQVRKRWYADLVRSGSVLTLQLIWFAIVMDDSRDIDLDTTQYVELDNVTSLYVWYDVVSCVALLLSLLSTMQYFEISDKLAIISRSLGVVAIDLPAFMFVFGVIFFILSYIGFLLYGPSLEEFSTYFLAMTSLWDMMLGNYMYAQLEPAIVPDNMASFLAAVLFFYSSVFLLLFLLANMMIAIFMDGYNTVKEQGTRALTVRDQVNTGSLSEDVKRLSKAYRRRMWRKVLRFLRCVHIPVEVPVIPFEPWPEEKWMRETTTILNRRKAAGLQSPVITVGTFIAELKELIKNRCCSQSWADVVLHIGEEQPLAEDIARQVRLRFIFRRFQKPESLERPFEAQASDVFMKRLSEKIDLQSASIREVLELCNDLAGRNDPAAEDSSFCGISEERSMSFGPSRGASPKSRSPTDSMRLKESSGRESKRLEPGYVINAAAQQATEPTWHSLFADETPSSATLFMSEPKNESSDSLAEATIRRRHPSPKGRVIVVDARPEAPQIPVTAADQVVPVVPPHPRQLDHADRRRSSCSRRSSLSMGNLADTSRRKSFEVQRRGSLGSTSMLMDARRPGLDVLPDQQKP